MSNEAYLTRLHVKVHAMNISTNTTMSLPAPLVYIADDEESVRRSMARLLKSNGHNCKTVASARELLESDLGGAPVCLILDLQMPGMDGFELQAKLNASDHPIPIIFLTGHGDIPKSVQAMKAGAANFFTKPVRGAVLLRAVEEALARAQRDYAAQHELQELKMRLSRLTNRERQVLDRIITGRLNKQVAHELGTSEKTVKVHRARVMEKMQAHSLVELVHMTDRLGLPRVAGEHEDTQPC